MRLADNVLPQRPGGFSWQTEDSYADGVRRVFLRLPCGHACALPVNHSSGWSWDGNEDAPTLTPSILCLTPTHLTPGGICHWHGYLTAGELRVA